MNTHGAVELIKPKLEVARFADPRSNPDIARMAEIAADLEAKAFQGGWVQLANFDNPEQGSAIVAKASFTTIQDICNPQKSFIPANSLHVGSQLRMHAWGTVGSAAGTATSTMGLYLNGAAGGTVLAVSAAQTPPTSTVNCWHLDAYATVLTIGTGGTIQVSGVIIGIAATQSTPVMMPATLPAAAAINTTQANGVTVAASWNTSAAGNTYSVYGWNVFVNN